MLCGNGPDLEHVVAEDREQLIFDGLGAGYRKCADEQVTGVVHEPSLAECSAGRYRIRRPLTSFTAPSVPGFAFRSRIASTRQFGWNSQKLHLAIAVEMRKCYMMAA